MRFASIFPIAKYIVDTSEFDQVKARLTGLESKQSLSAMDRRRPVLLKRTGAAGDGPASDGSSSSGSKEDPDRPTLKRAPNSQ